MFGFYADDPHHEIHDEILPSEQIGVNNDSELGIMSNSNSISLDPQESNPVNGYEEAVRTFCLILHTKQFPELAFDFLRKHRICCFFKQTDIPRDLSEFEGRKGFWVVIFKR